MKQLIINADDFGYSQIFNESILNLIEKDLIFSTTVMVNHITKEQEKQVKKLISLKDLHNVSIGLHLEFNNSNFKEKIKIQFVLFKEIFGFNPSHLDIHKPSNSEEEKLAIIDFCNKTNLPCRNLDFNKKIKTTSKVYLNGTDTQINKIKELVESLENNQTYEILFHPGTYDKNCKSSLNKQREEDIEKIKIIHPLLKENQIKLISYNDLN